MTYRERIKQLLHDRGIHDYWNQCLLDDVMMIVEEAKEYAYKEGKKFILEQLKEIK